MAKSTYNTLMSEIAKLQSQADSLRQKEIKDVIQNIQQQMRQYGLDPKDLNVGASGTGRRGRKPGSHNQPKDASQSITTTNQTGNKAAAKFRDPESGATWSGRGRMPKWINAALSQGRNKEEFAIS